MAVAPSGSSDVGYHTNPVRAAGALCVGAVAGASLVTADYVIGLLQVLGPEHVLRYGMRKSMIIFFFAWIVWIVGLLAVGTPFWVLFHRLGFRRWPIAMALGATLSFAISLGISTNGFGLIPPPPNSSYSASDSGGPTVENNKLTPHGWASAITGALLIAAYGAGVGWLVWRTAYKRSP